MHKRAPLYSDEFKSLLAQNPSALRKFVAMHRMLYRLKGEHEATLDGIRLRKIVRNGDHHLSLQAVH
ncbi:MAG: hypothetical protein NT051_01755 [Candidatus Micrarchaeota archaeon]|nr:hypothetical protein [Candidatus Micrarchaeota archaeon]